MRNVPVFILLLFINTHCTTSSNPSPPLGTGGGNDSIRVLKTGLQYPWEILWGKDNHIWMTERGGRISKIDPTNGATVFTHEITEVVSNGEGGLLGMVQHPDFNNNGFMYVVYNYNSNGEYREKLVMYRFSGNSLVVVATLIQNIAASSIHNGSRLWIIEGSSPKLFMTTGDASVQSNAQNTSSYNGKVLRFNLDGTIPADNPVSSSPVWSFGHRNQQGLVVANGIMYASEHGPNIEDEVNIIERGRNYGWNNVNGPCDQPAEVSFCNTNNVKEPIWSSGGNTIAVCGMDFYNHSRIPAWQNSLLVTCLKDASLRVLTLSADGRTVSSQSTFFKNRFGRIRDVCVSPAGRVYLCTSIGGNNDVLVEISKP